MVALLHWGVAPNTMGAQVAAAPLDTVTIVGSRTGITDAGRTVEIISRADIARSSARNVAELLALRTGTDVYLRSPAQADLSLRGSTSEQTLILVDGVRVSDAQSSHYALDLAVPLDAIERVEVLKGSASSLYGADAIGGVVNIVTRGGAGRAGGGAGMRVRGGAWGTAGASAQLAAVAGGWTTQSNLEAEKADGWRPGSDHRIGTARVSIAGAVGDDSVRVHLGTGVRSFGANAFYGAYNSKERTGATTADASWTRRHAAWLMTLGASTRYHTDRFTLVRDHPAIYENLHESWQTGTQVVLRRAVTHGALSLAADATNFQLVSSRLGSRHEWREGAAAQVTWLTAAMMLDVGARADQSSTYGGFLSPTVAFSVPVTSHLRLRTNASRGFRAPTWTERYYSDPANQGNADLAPEHFWSGEAGAKFVGGAHTMDIAVFVRRAANLIDWVKPACANASPPCTALWKATNVGNANYAGVEGSIAFAPVRGVTAVLSMMSLNFTDHQGAQLVGKYALRPLTQQLSARVSWLATPRLTVGGEAMHARRSGESAFITGTTHVSYTLAPQWDVTLDGTNLTNATWLDASGTVVPGRAAFAGVRWGR